MEEPNALTRIKLYLKPQILAMFFLGFGAGLPFLLVFSTLNYWLAESNVSKTTIGLFAFIGVIYSVKVLWSPLVDHLRIPLLSRLGRRRSWILVAQIGISLSLLAMSVLSPNDSLKLIAVAGLGVAIASATQDIALDAWRIEAIEQRYQGLMSAMYIFGYRLALLFAGAGALFIADWRDWATAYQVMAASMLVPIAVLLLLPADPHVARAKFEGLLPLVNRVIVAPFSSFFKSYGWAALLLLVFISIYRISDIAMGSMANPLYVDLGFTKSEVASVAKFFGFFMTMTGAFLCGLWVVRSGVVMPLFVGALLVAITNLLFAWLSTQGHSIDALIVVISADNLAGGMANTALIAFLSSLTNRHYTATQYALFSSLMTLPGKLFSTGSGWLVDHYGFFDFFLICAAFGVPAIVMVPMIRRVFLREQGDPKEESSSPLSEEADAEAVQP